MKLIIFAALAALCSAEKLDRTYLPPASAKTAGGTPGSLQTPLIRSDELPAGSFINDAQGVVVDVAAAGTRASPGTEETGLGGPRESYGSTVSKVGDAAFRESAFSQVPNSFARIAPIPEHETVIGPVYGNQVFKSKTLLPQGSKDYNSNTLSYQNNVESHKYNYGFETENGISVGENGVAHDGSHAQGGYSYKGNDGQDYKVTYTADKGGYQPQGSHLPTSPPIPHDIIKSIEQNAKEEAAGHHDDGSYDSQKYNAEGDYADNKNDDKHVNIHQNNQGSAVPGFGSVSTERPQAFSTYKPVYGSSGSVLSDGYGAFGPSKFGQNSQGFYSHTPSKTQFGQSSFGSQQTVTQFGSQFPQGSKPGFGSQTVKPEFGLSQPSQDPSTPSSFTQFGTQPGQQVFNIQNKPNDSLFGKPASSAFGSSTSNIGQAGSSNAEKEYLAPVSNDKPLQDADYQTPQFGSGSTPTFGSSVKPVGFVPQSQGSSAIASATVSGTQSSLSGLSPQVLGGLQSPSKSQLEQYTPAGSDPFGYQPSKPQSSVPQFGVKPVGLSSVSQPGSAYPQGFGLVGDKKQPQPAGFLVGSDDVSSGKQSQGADSAYYYNQPAKPFNSLSSTSQGSSLSAGQLSQTSNQFSSFNSQSSQKEQFSGSSKPFAPTSPTLSSGSYQPSHSGVTQAAVSPFPSVSPTPVSSFPQKVPTQHPFSQGSSNLFGQKPSTQKEQSFFSQTGSVTSVESQKTPVNSQNAALVPTQQYTGELYEYNKPQQGIPSSTPSSTPSSISVLGQPQATFSQGSLSSSQFGQPSVSGSKPASKPQFGLGQGSQSGSYFVNKQQGFQSQFNTQKVQGSQSQFGSQSYKPFGTQFGSQGNKFGQSQSSQSSFSQTQAQQAVQPIKPFGSSSQFGSSGSKPQFGQGSQSFQGSTSQSQQTTQQSLAQGNKPTNIYLPPISITSTLGVQGAKPQTGQGSQFSQGNSIQQTTQSTQQTVGSEVQQVQGSQTQFGSQPSVASQIGNQNKLQFGQGSQTSQSSFQQSTQQAVGSVSQTQGSLSQFGSQSYKPFGTQFGAQGNKPQYGSVPQKSQGNLFQAQTTSQALGTQQSPQGALSQFGAQPSKPLGSSQFGVQESKPQFGQTQTLQGSSLTQTGTQQQSSFGSQSQFESQSKKPFGSQSGFQALKPQFGQVATSQGSSVTQTQTTQQTIGSVINTQQQTQPGNVYLPSKPSTLSPQFGVQESKPQFGQVSSSQDSSFQQSTQQTVGSLGLSGGQPSKPFSSSSQFGTQGTKPQGSSFTQSPTTQQSGSTLIQQSGQGSQIFGSQPSKPFGSSQYGLQGAKPQGSSLGQSQASQQYESTVTQQQSGQGSQIFGSQPSKPFGSSQFGVQGAKPQGSSFGQSQTSQQYESTVTQQQSGQGSQIFGSQPSKPFGSSQFGGQGAKPQGSSFGQSQTSQQYESTVTQQQSGQGSQIFGSQPSKPFGSSQFGTQGNKPQFGQVGLPSQGSSLTQTQTTQQTVGSVTGTQQQPGSQVQFGSQSYKPFGASQLGSQGSKPQFGQTQTTQQSSFSQSQFSQQSSYNKFGQSKPIVGSSPAPFGSAFGTQPTKIQFGSSTQKTESTTGSSLSQFGSQFGQSSTQGTSQFGAQAAKPFSTSHHQEFNPQYGAPAKPAFGQSSTTYAPFTNNQNSQSQLGYQYKQPVTAFGKYQPKPLFGQTGFTGFSSSQASSSASSFPQASKGTFGSQAFKPFGTQIQPFKSQFGVPTSSASAFASSSSTPAPISGSKYSIQPFATPSSVFPTAQPAFGQATTASGPGASGTQVPSVTSVPGSGFGVHGGVSSTPQPLGAKPNFGFSKPCCQASQFGHSSTASPSFGVSSTPSSLSTPQDAQKTEDFKGPKQPQGFDEKTGYYY